MITPYLLVLVWIFCGGVAWDIATKRKGNSQFWAVIGQVLGPFSIPLALSIKPKQKS